MDWLYSWSSGMDGGRRAPLRKRLLLGLSQLDVAHFVLALYIFFVRTKTKRRDWRAAGEILVMTHLSEWL